MRKLVDLHRQGCEVDVIATNLDGDILAGLVSAGIRVRPFFLRARGTALPQVIVHSKFWLVDARSTRTGERTPGWPTPAAATGGRTSSAATICCCGSPTTACTPPMTRYWELIRDRAAVRPEPRPPPTRIPPASALTAVPAPNAAGWNRTDVTLRIAASDGHNVQNARPAAAPRGDARARRRARGTSPGEVDASRLAELVVTAEGETTVTYRAEDERGNLEPERIAHRADRPHAAADRRAAGRLRAVAAGPPDGARRRRHGARRRLRRGGPARGRALRATAAGPSRSAGARSGCRPRRRRGAARAPTSSRHARPTRPATRRRARPPASCRTRRAASVGYRLGRQPRRPSTSRRGSSATTGSSAATTCAARGAVARLLREHRGQQLRERRRRAPRQRRGLARELREADRRVLPRSARPRASGTPARP